MLRKLSSNRGVVRCVLRESATAPPSFVALQHQQRQLLSTSQGIIYRNNGYRASQSYTSRLSLRYIGTYDLIPIRRCFVRSFSTAQEDESTLTANKKKQPKRKKQKGSPPANTAETTFPLQSRRNAEILFDALAPHLEYETLVALNLKLKNVIDSNENDDIKVQKAHTTVLGYVKSILKGGSKLKRPRKKKNQPTPDESLASQDWIMPIMARFFGGEEVLPISEQMATDLSNSLAADICGSDPTFVPNRNREHLNEYIEILQTARTQSTITPLLWSTSQKRRIKKQDQQLATDSTSTKAKELENKNNDPLSEYLQEVVHYGKEDDTEPINMDSDDSPQIVIGAMEARSLHLQAVHNSKGEKIHEQEARSLALFLVDHLPSSSYDKLRDLLETYPSSDHPRMSLLFSNIRNCVGSFHIHLVASQLADFFYMDIPFDSFQQESQETNCVDGEVEDSKVNLILSAFDEEAGEISGVAKGDPRVRESRKEWDATRQAFVDCLIEAQTSFCTAKSATMKEQATKTKRRKDLEELSVKTIPELDLLRTRPSDGVQIGRDRQMEENQHKGGPYRRKTHLLFDAILLNDSIGKETVSGIKSPSNEGNGQLNITSDRTVFIDNLPIDMEDEEIVDFYSACGEVESVHVFNRRPDLDPGPLSSSQQAARRQKQRTSLKQRRRLAHETRDRSPLYAIVTFVTKSGYETAIDAPLRIFGMVVRRHPMRSQKASDMKTLYIENIPTGFYALDMESKLSKVLHPEIYVSLDMGQHDYSEPTSLEIRFASFEAASYAFQYLQQVDMGSADCALNWMKTPQTAMEYWTREMAFD
eukprot:scaffold2345_cov51-Attheya_sp.AAC.4